MSNNNSSSQGFNVLSFIFCLFTAIVGYTINNHSFGWAVVDFLFAPLAWIKWIICHDVSWSIIQQAFSGYM